MDLSGGYTVPTLEYNFLDLSAFEGNNVAPVCPPTPQLGSSDGGFPLTPPTTPSNLCKSSEPTPTKLNPEATAFQPRPESPPPRPLPNPDPHFSVPCTNNAARLSTYRDLVYAHKALKAARCHARKGTGTHADYKAARKAFFAARVNDLRVNGVTADHTTDELKAIAADKLAKLKAKKAVSFAADVKDGVTAGNIGMSALSRRGNHDSAVEAGTFGEFLHPE